MMKAFSLLLIVVSLSALQASAQTPTPASETSKPFSIADSASYIGKYKFEGLPFEYMVVSVKEDKLYFEGGEYNGFLEPMKDKKDIFNVHDVATFTFLRNADNKITDLQIDYQGTYVGKKEEKKE